MQFVAMVPRLKNHPTLVVSQLVVAHPAIFVKKQKMLGRFWKSTLLRFSCASSEDTCDFLVS